MIYSDYSFRLKWLLENKLDEIVHSMSLEEKVGQVFTSFIYGNELTEFAAKTINESKLGNIIYYTWANELNDPKQVKLLSEQIQKLQTDVLGLPAIISVDQEGGIVSRLTKNFTEFPGNMALAATNDPSLAKKVGLAMGKEMKAVGITQTFGPVVDINNEPNNPVIGTRSFGDDPKTVIEFANAVTDGLHEAGMLVCSKHYSGHGDTKVDLHTGLPNIGRSKQELYDLELKPFIALKDKADSIMSAHILVPQVDPKNPVSLSPIFLTDILRGEIGYQGVIISDSLVMKGVVPEQKTFEQAVEGVSQAALKAFNAGSDCLILGRLEWADFKDATSPEISQQLTLQVLSNFKKAVEDGTLSKNRLDESVKRMLSLKRKAALQEKTFELSEVKCDLHVMLAEHVTREALTLVSSKELFSNCNTALSGRKIAIVAPEELKDKIEENDYNSPALFKNQDLKTSLDNIVKDITTIVKDADLTIFLSFNGHVFKEQITLLEKLAKELPERKLIVAGLRNPQDVMIKEIYKKHLVYLTYSHSAASLKTLFEALDSHTLPPGNLPMQCLYGWGIKSVTKVL